MAQLSVAQLNQRLHDQQRYRPLDRRQPRIVTVLTLIFNWTLCGLIVAAGAVLYNEPDAAPRKHALIVEQNDSLAPMTERELWGTK